MGKFYNGTSWTKSTFWGVETKCMFIHTRGRAHKRSAKFGRQKRTFGGKKEEKAVSQIKSDRLYYYYYYYYFYYYYYYYYY